MSVYRPQTFSAMFAILTIFATSAWGQRMGTETPIYTSSHSIFGADSLVDRDGRLKAAINGATNIAPPAARRSVSSDLGADSLVNRDGMLKGAIDGVTNVASPTTRNTNSSSLGANSFVDRDGRLKGVKNGAATAASSLKGSASKNTIGSKLGSDSLVDKDGQHQLTKRIRPACWPPTNRRNASIHYSLPAKSSSSIKMATFSLLHGKTQN